MAFLNNKFWQVYFLKQSEKLKFYEVLILGFIRFYSLLKQSAKLTLLTVWQRKIASTYTRVVVPKPEFSVVDQRKIALVNELRNFRTVTQCGYGHLDHTSNATKWVPEPPVKWADRIFSFYAPPKRGSQITSLIIRSAKRSVFNSWVRHPAWQLNSEK